MKRTDHESLIAMRLALARLSISMPPVPDDFVSDLKEIGDNTFATRDLPAPLYDATTYIEEYFSGSVSDYLAVGIDGYGMLNYYFHYYLVRSGFAIFLQSPVVDEAGMVEPIAALNAQLERVAKAIDTPGKASTALVDVIGAKYIAYDGAKENDNAAHLVVNPLEHYLASPNTAENRVAMIKV